MTKHLKRYKLTDVLPGMILGEAILANNSIILSDGTILNHLIIERLNNLGIRNIKILEPVNSDIADFKYIHIEITNTLSKSFNHIRYFKEVPLPELSHLAEQTIDGLMKSSSVLNQLAKIGGQNDYTFSHSVNVGIIGGILAKWLGFNQSLLREVVLAGFLHDVGKTQIPLEILDKPGDLSLSEMELIKAHSTLGYQLVQSSLSITEAAKLAILQHHERIDGSGYPLGLKEEGISYLAKIIAIADIYSALNLNRPYRKAITPFLAMDELSNEMFSGKIDPTVCTLFLSHLQESLVGTHVKLSTGETGEVIYINRSSCTQPVVKIDNNRYLDLSEKTSISIVDMYY